MPKLVLAFPDEKSPGYLRFIRSLPELQAKAAGLSEVIGTNKMTAQQVDELVDIILAFVVEPANKAEARKMIFDASADDLVELLNVLAENLK